MLATSIFKNKFNCYGFFFSQWYMIGLLLIKNFIFWRCFSISTMYREIKRCYFILINSVKIWIFFFFILQLIVFKPGPVQGPSSGFLPDHQVARVNSYVKKKSKQRRFSKKNKGLQPGFVGSPGSTRQVMSDHDFSYFFFNLVRFQSRINRVPS